MQIFKKKTDYTNPIFCKNTLKLYSVYCQSLSLFTWK